jgi:hypothetical protein
MGGSPNKIAACKQNGRQIAPLSKLNAISFINLLNKEPLRCYLQTLHNNCRRLHSHISCHCSNKWCVKNKFPCSSIAPSNNPNTRTVINPPKSARTSHGNLALLVQGYYHLPRHLEIPAANW